MYPYGETVTIHHPAGPQLDGEGDPVVDDYGTPIINDPTDEDVEGVAVAPGDTRENLNQQTTLAVAYTLYFQPPVTVEHDAQVTVRGTRYQVEGLPKDWRNPYTGFTGLEVAVGASQ